MSSAEWVGSESELADARLEGVEKEILGRKQLSSRKQPLKEAFEPNRPDMLKTKVDLRTSQLPTKKREMQN